MDAVQSGPHVNVSAGHQVVVAVTMGGLSTGRLDIRAPLPTRRHGAADCDGAALAGKRGGVPRLRQYGMLYLIEPPRDKTHRGTEQTSGGTI
jgi:hypothetical protein